MERLKIFINKCSNSIYNFVKKCLKLLDDNNNSLLFKAIIKLLVLLIIYILVGLIADCFISIGTSIIYNFGTTARGIISTTWSIIVHFIYFLFVIVSLYKMVLIAEEDDGFLSLYRNKKKDKKTKDKIFSIVENVIKALSIVVLIPIFIIDIGLLFAFGILIGYLRQGIYLYSLFVFVAGLIIFFTVLIFIIKTLFTKSESKLKRYVYTLIFSCLVVAGSCIFALIETNSYETNTSLTTDFTMSSIVHEYKINTNKEYVITNNGTDSNIEIVIDDDLGSYIDVVVSHATTNNLNTYLDEESDTVTISYIEELDLGISDLENLLNLGVTCIKEKTIYNYTLLKYADIKVYVSSDYAKYIKFVDSHGKEYYPYEED